MNENRPNSLSGVARGPAPEPGDNEFDLGTLLGTLWHGKWLIAAVTALFILAAGSYAVWLATPLYPATAELALRQQQEQIFTDIESVISGGSASEEMINTEIDVMTSRKLFGRLVDRLDLTGDPEFNETLRDPALLSSDTLIGLITGGVDEPPTPEEIRNWVIDAVEEAISVRNRRDSLTLLIHVTTEDPVKSVRIANTLAELYIDDQVREKIEALERASTFLSNRTAELKQELGTAQSELNSFHDQVELVRQEQLVVKSELLKSLRERQSALQADVASARSRLERLRALLASENYETLAEEMRSPALARAIAAHAAGERREIDLRRAAAEAVATAETQLSRQEAQLAALKESAERLGTELDRQSEKLIRFQQLEREVEATRLLYESFLARLKETNIQRGLAQADARMLSEAVPPREPSSPKVLLILALSGVLGVMAGSGVVLGREAMHQGLRTIDELTQATGHVVLGTIPTAPVRASGDVIRYLREKPTSAVAEAVRNLRTSILLSNIDNPPKVIMLTSSVPGEGKTTISLALAQNMAALGQRILLIEGDIRRRSFAQHFDIERATGLLDAIENHAILDGGSMKMIELGVDLLVGSKIQVNAADLFSSQKFRDFIAAARDRYDHVIIDTPPVLVVPDARVIGQEADAILFAVKWDETGRTQIRDSLEMFRTVGLRVTGLVMTQVDGRRMKRYGYDAYDKYYHG